MAKVEMKKVVSSNVDSLGYCSQRGMLFVKFLGGGVYSYAGISQTMFDETLSSKSVGSDISRIARGGYKTVKVVDLEKELEIPVSVLKEKEPKLDNSGKKQFQTIAELVFSQVEVSIAPKQLVSIFGNKVDEGEQVYPVILFMGFQESEEGGQPLRKFKTVPVKVGEVKVFDLSMVFDGVKYDDAGYLVPVVSLRNARQVVGSGCCGGKGLEEDCKCKGD